MSWLELSMCAELGLIYGIIALGIFISFRVLNFTDLTCDGSFVLGAAVCGIALQANCNPVLALMFALAAGAIAGLVTGALHFYFKVTDLLAGILVAFMLYSINLKVMQGVPNIALLDVITISSARSNLLILGSITVLVCAMLSYFLNTDYGLAMRSIGHNKKLVKTVGVNLRLTTIVGLMLSNGLIALGGGLFTQQQGFADISSGLGTVVVGLAAIMIGERIIPARSVWLQVLTGVVGSIVYRILITFAMHSDVLGLQTQDLNLITGILVIAIMLLPRGKNVSFA